MQRGRQSQPNLYLCAQLFMHVERHHWSAFHVYVPQLERHVVARKHVPSIASKLDVGYASDNLQPGNPHARTADVAHADTCKPAPLDWMVHGRARCLHSSITNTAPVTMMLV
eukprot:365763-Chlamydomonas_euryale.AAC.6